MFDPKSRYANLATYTLVDRKNQEVTVVPAAPDHGEVSIGVHVRRDGQRLDHLARRYLANPAGYWRIAELSGVMLPDVLTEQREIEIPRKAR